MDFSDSRNNIYSELDVALLPCFYLLYNTSAGMQKIKIVYTLSFTIDVSGGDSGTVHSTVKERWAKQDPDLVSGMAELGSYADQAVESLQKKDYSLLARLMDKNFLMRRRLYGDEVVGSTNIAAVALANTLGFAAKFTGSGGAILCLSQETPTEW